VHANASMDPEKVRHWRPSKNCPSGLRVLIVFHVLRHNPAVLVDVIAVKTRNVVDILVRNAELTGTRVVAFSAS
jgi:hypothetical protein